MSLCKICNTASKNTGKSENDIVFGDVSGIFLWSIKNNVGGFNELDCSVPLDQTALDLLLNAPDVPDRLLPIQDLENWDSPLPAEQEESFGSGNVTSLGNEIRSATVLIPKTSGKFSGQINNAGSCGSMGIIFMDDCGNLKGNNKVDGFVRPIKLARNTWNAVLDWARAGANAQNTMITFRFDKSERDADHGVIVAGSFEADFEGAEGLLDVNITNIAGSAATDTIVFDAKEIFGDACDLNDIQGLVPADLTIIVNAVTTTITGLVQLIDGSWEATVSDDLLISQDGSIKLDKSGLEIVTETFVMGA